MEYRNIHGTDFKVSEICFGTWPISGHGMGKTDEQESITTIKKAIDLGINYIDTADFYGFGYAEELLQKVLGSQINEMIVSTKVGLEWDGDKNYRTNLKPDYIIRACENSLQRLQVDKIDLYQLHWPDPETPITETAEALDRLLESGKVRYIGVSNFSVEQLKELQRYVPVVSNQVEYSLINKRIENDVIPYCHDHKISIFPYKVLGRGILTGKFDRSRLFSEDDWRKDDFEFQKTNLEKYLNLVDEMIPIAEKYGKTMSQLAIAWTLRWSNIPSVVIGARRPRQIEESCGGSGWDIQQEDINTINQLLMKL